MEVFLRNGMHVLTLSNIKDDELLKFINGDSTAKFIDTDLYVITEGAQLFSKLDGDWSYEDILTIFKKNLVEIIDRNAEYKSLFGLPIVERPGYKESLFENGEISGIEQSLFDFDESETIRETLPNELNIQSPPILLETKITTNNHESSKNYFPDEYVVYEPGKRKKLKTIWLL